ncbi:chromophore lyase CpcT/CpeT [Stenomitos frigidus]|uniref:Chorismate mutase n=1 Tax=Stenomitos frigidus ULC18 TaxID=2107698 RepID=A0A2T1DTL4_9CYAN|nr:chromophore lyase CpcT/CpeT [Stenomitos frigidus]PSB23843.1 chorismate mutase [Stenomitos frigidus ULC18]
MYRAAIALTPLLLLIMVQRSPAGTPMPLEQQVEAVATRLEGVMDTAAQASVNPKVSNVRMTSCRVPLAEDENALQSKMIMLYQEQALADELTKPYRQRFLQLSASPMSQSVRSRAFKPAHPAAWVNFCNKLPADRTVKPEDMGTVVCNVFLRHSGDDYVGNTPADGCAANVRGTVRIKNHIVLRQSGMDTWDRGFDAAGRQVWGAKAESYQFRRRL